MTPAAVSPPALPSPTPAMAPEAVAAPLADPAQAERQRFGVKERRPEEPDFIDIVIVSISRTKLGKLVYRTEDGQVWRQSDNRRPPAYRKTPFAARVKKGALGSFFIKPDDGGYAVRVQRQK